MKRLQLTNSKRIVLVDDDIDPRIVKMKFCLTNSGYAMTKKGYLHHFVLGRPSEGFVTDHIDRNRLNNQRFNLRFVTRAQNNMNATRWSNNTSGFKGVTWVKKDRKWQAQTKVNGRSIYLGQFSTAEDAARAYDEAVRRLHPGIAPTNFPVGDEGRV